MLISINWIKDFVDLEGVDLKGLIDRFTLSTAEVEEIIYKGAEVSGVVAGRIVDIKDHPSSKKLHIVTVEAGNGEVTCVCGAPNVRAGMTVPFAPVGARVVGMEIGRAVVAGVESQGMCCSEKELGVSDDHSGLMELDSDVLPGTDIKTLLPIDDVVFEVDNKSLTNRPDLWGHFGIAREIAAISGRPLKQPALFDVSPFDSLPEVPIHIMDAEKCLRYSAMRFDGITVKTTPPAMRVRLYYCGMRAINLLADLTNYVMLELGQPMHAFDSDKVGGINVRCFGSPFDFKTLDGNARQIDPETLMICSRSNDNDVAVAIAGIMGGLDSEIAEETTSVTLESANFSSVSTRKSSARLGLRTEASQRYEKSLDPELTEAGIRRFAQLLVAADPGMRPASRFSDSYARKYPDISLTITREYIDRYTGIHIPDGKITDTLAALGFGVKQEDGRFDVEAPTWRATKDVSIKADLIEEITRIYGYDNFEVKSASAVLAPVRQSAVHELEYAVKLLLAERFSMSEVHSYYWYDGRIDRELGIHPKSHLGIVNSPTPETAALRACMAPSMLYAVNANKGQYPEFGLFEVGRVAAGLDADGVCVEKRVLSMALYGRGQLESVLALYGKACVDTIGINLLGRAFDYTGAEELEGWNHPSNTVDIRLQDGKKVGVMGVLHPSVRDRIDKKAAIFIAELDVDALAAAGRKNPVYREASRFPSISMDLSLLTGMDMPYAEIEDIIKGYECEELQTVELVGIYKDMALEDQKSVTVRLVFQSYERTLSSEEAAAWSGGITERLAKDGIVLKG